MRSLIIIINPLLIFLLRPHPQLLFWRFACQPEIYTLLKSSLNVRSKQDPNFSRLIAAKGSFATSNGGGVLEVLGELISELSIHAELV